jgi:hypothetical protein
VPGYSPAPDWHIEGSPLLRPCQIHTPPGYLPLSHAGLQPLDPHHTGIPTLWLHHWIHNHWDLHHLSMPDPSMELVPQLARIPTSLPRAHHPSGPAEPQLHVEWLDSHPTDSSPPPANQALPGSRSMWNDWSPTPLGKAPAWYETATSTSSPGTGPLRQNWFQLFRLPRWWLHQAPTQATTRGLQACLRDTHRLDWTLKR